MDTVATDWDHHTCSKHAVVSRNNNGLLDVKEVSMPKQKLTDDETAALNALCGYLGPLSVLKIARKLGWDEPRVLLALEGLKKHGYINLVSRNNNGLLDVKEVSTPKQELTDDETLALNVLYDYLGPLPVPKIARKLGWDEPRVLLALEGLKKHGYIDL